MGYILAEIERNKSENVFCHLYFLNKDISVTNREKLLKISEVILKVCFEGSVSQICYLGPSFYFMLCRKKYFKNITNVSRFLI